VPFIIVIVMGLPATKAVVAMKDTTNADLTIKVTGYAVEMGLRLHQGRGRGHWLSFPPWTATQRAMSDSGGPKAGEP